MTTNFTQGGLFVLALFIAYGVVGGALRHWGFL